MPRTSEHTETDLPRGHVRARVLPNGDQKIFTGEYDAATHEFTRHPKGAIVTLAEAGAWALEARGFVEIL